MSSDKDLAPELGQTEEEASSQDKGAPSQKREAPPQVVQDAVRWSLEKKAVEPVLLDVRGICSYADFLLVAAGRSTRQVRAVADAILRGMREDGHRPYSAEGLDEARWVLIDFGDLVVHVFLEELRDFYDLEGLWAEAPRRDLEREAARRPAAP